MKWTVAVVEVLCEAKRHGLPFDSSWELAIRRHPPRLRELGVLGAPDDLLNQNAADTLDWYRGVCQRAYEDAPAWSDPSQPGDMPWLGQRSRLNGLHAAIRDGFAERDPIRNGRVGRARGAQAA